MKVPSPPTPAPSPLAVKTGEGNARLGNPSLRPQNVPLEGSRTEKRFRDQGTSRESRIYFATVSFFQEKIFLEELSRSTLTNGIPWNSLEGGKLVKTFRRMARSGRRNQSHLESAARSPPMQAGGTVRRARADGTGGRGYLRRASSDGLPLLPASS